MERYLYWHHKTTDHIYAVRITQDGVLDGAYGPIPRKKATPTKLPHWPFSSAEGEQLRRRLLEFEIFKRE